MVRAAIVSLLVAALATAAAIFHRESAAPPALTCDGERATIIGTSGRDTIVGTLGDDVILGLDGEDLIDGAGGDDVICGGDDHDRLSGGSGQDRLLGGLGNDRLSGGAGTWEPLAGGAGRDELDISDIWWPPPHEDRCFGARGIVPCPVEPIMIEPMPMSSRA